ncbi:hepatocyte cell adhesion molecule [Carcharodon carcharias]|uniref:hepatocyte cell adhesion molecule n=1 Tax=Carcharodon carcharias TaxID=13397 RepID=UPI001B7DE326|nr:hepatocyte cell adhesion molecule [Carcharodon carcharias]
MLPSRIYLTSFITLLLGQLQGAFARTIPVTGFLHRPICLAVENKIELSSVQTIKWQRSNQLIVLYQNNETDTPVIIFRKYKERVTYIAENNSLLIHQVNLQDEGHYKITTILKTGMEAETFINLTVLVPVSGLSITVQTDDLPHPTLTMNCTATNGSNPHFSWLKDNKTLLVDLRVQLSTENRSLGITNLTSSDCGTYICIVQNSINRVQAQQLITSEHFQECLHLQRRVLVIAVAVLSVIGFMMVFLAIKNYKERQWELWSREQMSGEGDLFREDEIQNEHSQTNRSGSGDGSRSGLYSYLHFIPSSENQEDEDPSKYCNIGPPTVNPA